MTKIVRHLFLFFVAAVAAQEKPQKQELPESPYADDVRDLIIDGNDYLEDNAFAKAEASYREAVALDPTNVAAKYNAGNNYYENEKWEESTARLLKATEVAQTKKEKHKAFHNLGNALYQQKDFKTAVEAYKNALRNDPTDEETRYNLALAKEEEEQNGGGGGGGGDDENEDQDKNQDKGQNEKNDDGEGDKEESEDGEKEETEDEGEEEENESEQKENEDGKPKDKDQEQPGDKGEQEKAPPPQPREGQLSPQQVKSLLEAMKNQEQKTQDKINAQKVKGAKVKTEKDW